MLPRKLHLEQINRFHDKVESFGKRINEEKNIKKQRSLSLKYFELSQLWVKIDEFIEFTVKQELDNLKH